MTAAQTFALGISSKRWKLSTCIVILVVVTFCCSCCWCCSVVVNFFFPAVDHHHPRQCLNREGRWDTTDNFATSFLHFFPFSPQPSRTCRTPSLSITWCCLPISPSVCCWYWYWSCDLMACFRCRLNSATCTGVGLRLLKELLLAAWGWMITAVNRRFDLISDRLCVWLQNA